MDRETKSVRRVRKKEERKEREEIRSLPSVCRPPIPLSRSIFFVRAVREGDEGTCPPPFPPSLPPFGQCAALFFLFSLFAREERE